RPHGPDSAEVSIVKKLLHFEHRRWDLEKLEVLDLGMLLLKPRRQGMDGGLDPAADAEPLLLQLDELPPEAMALLLKGDERTLIPGRQPLDRNRFDVVRIDVIFHRALVRDQPALDRVAQDECTEIPFRKIFGKRRIEATLLF